MPSKDPAVRKAYRDTHKAQAATRARKHYEKNKKLYSQRASTYFLEHYKSGQNKSQYAALRTKNYRIKNKEIIEQKRLAKPFKSEYISWQAMKQRCNNPKSKSYKNYGGNGVTYDPKLEDFEVFMSIIGPKSKPTNLYTIDRIDGSKGYEIDNIKWSTKKEQAQNMKSNRRVTYNNETKILIEWARLYNINVFTLWSRLDRGWPLHDAFNIPIK